MPRLIEIDKCQEKRVTHKDCGAVIGYYENELQTCSYTDYGGGSNTDYFIICPHCGEKVVVKSY